MARKKIGNGQKFEGFKKKYLRGFFTYPLEVADYWQYLSGSSQKVLDMVIRHTLGFQKTKDVMSIDQIRFGVGSASKGTGLSRSQVRRALVELEEIGFIIVHHKNARPSTIELKIHPSETTFFQTLGMIR